MINTYVFTKGEGTIIQTQAIALNTGETLTSVTVGAATPASTNSPVLTLLSDPNDPTLMFSIDGGSIGFAYGFPLTLVTNQRTLVVTIAVNVVSPDFNPYRNEDPDSYQDLVGSVEAGKSALSTTMFQLPASFDPSGGYVLWDILDGEGTVFASGNAFSYSIRSTGQANVVIAKSIVNVPANIPPTTGTPYQLRYSANINGQVLYSYESLTVHGNTELQLGTQDSVEFQGDLATLSLVTAQMYSNYVIELWAGNTAVASQAIMNPERVSNGYFVSGTIDTSSLPASCVPYQIVWKYWNVPAQTFRETAALYIITASMGQAVDDVRSKVNKARQTLYGTADSQYPSTEILKWLRRGMDGFNGAFGVFTSFTMTNAMGGVREFWLMYAELGALEAQYLLEGEKAFQFQGAAISLDVDRTSFLDNAAGKIQARIDNEVKPFKQNLVIKGNTGGDGSGPNGDGDFSALQRGAMGAVGITITPASLYGGFPGFMTRPF